MEEANFDRGSLYWNQVFQYLSPKRESVALMVINLSIFSCSLYYSCGLLQEDWLWRKMLLKSSAGFVLILLSHCTTLVTTKEAVVLANAHLLSQRDYGRLANINDKGTHEGGVSDLGVCCVLLYCLVEYFQHIWKLALQQFFEMWTCPIPKFKIHKPLPQLTPNSRGINCWKYLSKKYFVAFEDLLADSHVLITPVTSGPKPHWYLQLKYCSAYLACKVQYIRWSKSHIKCRRKE